MLSQFIKNFTKISKKDVSIAGGKGASLGEMLKAGLLVPPGFVITAKAFDYFLEKDDTYIDIEAQLEKVNYEDTNTIDRYSNVVRDIIADTPMSDDLAKEIISAFKKLGSKFVAVRSSATAEDSSVASWAGELETYLNTTEKTLLGNVKKCWSSLFTPRAIFYRKEKDLHKTKVSVAVVVQGMVESEISGICFTVHPVTQDKNQMIIEAGWGLGEAIVSGAITPDAYVISKLKVKSKKLKVVEDLEILDINVSRQERKLIRCLKKGVKWVAVPKSKQGAQVLSGDKIIELAKICDNIEKHYKKPQDIEWALKDGKFYITQSRPITTL